MTLGSNINRLRTARGMSQGELADALEVSRQSISKWETDASTPELDKLLRLAELFGVTLDELVKGEKAPAEAPPDVPAPQTVIIAPRPGLPGHKIAAIVLFGMAFLVWLAGCMTGGLDEGVALAFPFLLCGLLCFLCARHPALACLWALFLMADLFFRWGAACSWRLLFQVNAYAWLRGPRLLVCSGQLLGALALLAGTVWALRRGSAVWDERSKSLLALGIALFVLLSLPFSSWLYHAPGFLYILVPFLADSLRLGLLAWFFTAFIRRRNGTPS